MPECRIDLFSDTKTRPSSGMRRSLSEFSIEASTVFFFEKRSKKLLIAVAELRPAPTSRRKSLSILLGHGNGDDDRSHCNS